MLPPTPPKKNHKTFIYTYQEQIEIQKKIWK